MSAENKIEVTPSTPVDNIPITNNTTDNTSNTMDSYKYFNQSKPSFFKNMFKSVFDDAISLLKSSALGITTGLGAFKGVQYIFNNLPQDEAKTTLWEFLNNYPQYKDKYGDIISKLGTGALVGSLIAYGGWTLLKSLWNFILDKYKYNNNKIEYENNMKDNESTFRNYYNIPDEKEKLFNFN